MEVSMSEDSQIEQYAGPRDALRRLFELAEDSATELDSYLYEGRVWVARHGDRIVGHLQVLQGGAVGTAEIKNMAVLDDQQRKGIGKRLVETVRRVLAAESVDTLIVATATADIGNLRFYQRQGFRFRGVERDVFTPDRGYPPGLLIDGIPLRDRVWLDRPTA
jgi:GNAT superfamily N-acetyltransferase